jgi:hypothetical protein
MLHLYYNSWYYREVEYFAPYIMMHRKLYGPFHGTFSVSKFEWSLTRGFPLATAQPLRLAHL